MSLPVNRCVWLLFPFILVSMVVVVSVSGFILPTNNYVLQRSRHVIFASSAPKKKFKNFEDMLSNFKQPVLVNFSTTWCGPCNLMEKELHKTTEQVGTEKLQVSRVDSDKFPTLSSRFGVEALPTTILFKEGKPVHKFVGVVTAGEIIDQLRFFLDGNLETMDKMANDVMDSIA